MQQRHHPGVVAPPPLLYGAAFLLVLLAQSIEALPVSTSPAVRWTGWVVLASGIILNLWGAASMMRTRTPINPYRPVSAVITWGAFHVSRNPLYLGLDLAFLGLSLILNTLWGLIILVPVLVIMHYGVILREERYLHEKFAEPYQQYCATVRRYL